MATPVPEPPKKPSGDGLLLDELSDRLDSLKLFRERDPQQADAILEQFGAQGQVEYQMLDQLSVRAPLEYPERFGEAHRTAMHALEVYDRNGGRRPSNLSAGFLAPAAEVVVGFLIGIIVHRDQRRVIDAMRELYALREARSVEGTPEFHDLRLARKQVTRLAPDLSNKSVSLPAFLLGGAVLSTVTSFLQKATSDKLILVLLSIVVAVVCLGAFWCILAAAALARRRTRIALDRPLAALWETIGAAGTPPRDTSRAFAMTAAFLLVVAWIVVPIALAVVITLT